MPVKTRIAGGLPVALYVVLLVAPAVTLYRDPRPSRAWWWSVWAIATLACLVMIIGFFVLEPDLFYKTATLWPQYIVVIGIAAMQALVWLAVPITIVASRSPRRRERNHR